MTVLSLGASLFLKAGVIVTSIYLKQYALFILLSVCYTCVSSWSIFSTDGLQRRVIIHVTFLKIGEIDEVKEQYDADLLMRCKWREPTLDHRCCKAEVGFIQVFQNHWYAGQVVASVSNLE